MTRQYIKLKSNDWGVLVYYNVGKRDFVEITDSLLQLYCPKQDIKKALSTIRKKNSGFTFSNFDYKMTVVCIGKATTIGQFINTTIHEAKHAQSHICQYYNIKENTEDAAYLIGHIVHKMYDMLERILRSYINMV